MRIILLKTIDKLGRRGEVKNVADGYARNFLLARGLAALATEQNIKKFARTDEGKAEEKTSKTSPTPEQIAGRLRGVVLSFSENADENGTLFAGINKEKLAKALSEKGVEVKPKQIELKEPIKKLGEYRVEVSVTAGIKSKFRVIIGKIQVKS
ncbi:50S ribosomal protein L9 [Candidatus Falkowbacteria bacterium]|nr:50S ribosomal protein L9 [Candidatus Falkowbacteria bacterium]